VDEADSIKTSQSLLVRLKDWGDQASWREFFDTYWRLIHATACKAGLTPIEAEEVVQEVMIAVAKKMPGFTYEPGKDSLKGWLLSVTRWKVVDQFRNRNRAMGASGGEPGAARDTVAVPNDDTVRTATAERVPDPKSIDLDAIWDGEWRENLLRSALDRVKRRVNPAHYEMYHLHVVQGLSPRETASALAVSKAAVHLAKYRVGKLVKAELKRLSAENL